MGTSTKRSIFSGTFDIGTSYASIGGTIDVGGYDAILVEITITPESLNTLTIGLLTGGAPLFRSSSAGGSLERDEIGYPVSNGNTLAFKIKTEGLKEISLQAKGNAAEGEITSVSISPEGSDSRTPVSA